MSNHRFCCCGPGCTSNFRVFMPCSDTYDTVEVLPVVLTVAQFAASGFSENTVYLYDASPDDCDDFCGQWICTNSADAEDALCYSDSNDCPACEEWGGTEPPPPWRAIRPSEEAAFYARFTEMDDGGCCDQRCPFVDCGFGQIIPTDCAVCYDPALLSWAVDFNWEQTQQAECDLAYRENNSGDECTLSGALRTVQCDVSIYNITPVISGTDLTLCIELQYLFTKNMTDDCGVYDFSDTGGCEEPCAPSDPGTDVPGTQWVWYGGASVTIPCMAFVSTPTVGACSGTTTGVDSTMCGGLFNLPSPSFTTNSVNSISPIGWGGNAEIYVRERGVSWGAGVGACLPCGTGGTSGAGTWTLRLSASLPDRPEDCP